MVRNERKQSIRRDMLRQRAFLTPEERQLASCQLAVHLQAFLDAHFPREGDPVSLRKTLHIAVYAAMRNELDLSSCWELLQNWPAVLYFPAVIKTKGDSPAVIKMDTSENIRSDRLWFAPLPALMTPSDLLSPRTFGVPEPPPEVCLTPENLPPLDLVLVPGLAFDRWGNRIGWGKAYYDGFLARLRSKEPDHNQLTVLDSVGPSSPDLHAPSPLCIGVCYDFQLLDQVLPHDAHDQRLQGVLTPRGWHPTRQTDPTDPTHPTHPTHPTLV